MARKLGHEFRKMFTRCNEFYRALCEHCEYTAKMFCSLWCTTNFCIIKQKGLFDIDYVSKFWCLIGTSPFFPRS